MDLRIERGLPTYPHQKHWQFCVGSGHAHLALRTDYVKQLKFIHDELGIQRVRFHGILHDDMSTYNTLRVMLPFPGTENFKEINFRACGVAYDNILAAGMKPFVEISFMPRELASKADQGGFIYYNPNVSMPKDWDAWKNYIRAFIRFLLHRYGEAEVRSWYFEIWNEPDLGSTFFSGGDEGYFRLYRETVEAIKSVDEQLMVGGPSTSGSKWIKHFRKMCEEHHVPLDFLSTHQYAGDPIAGVEDNGSPEDASGESTEAPAFTPEKLAFIQKKLEMTDDKSFLGGMRALLEDKSETMDIPADIFKKNAAVVRQQAGDYPLFYTEWGSNAIFSAATNDTRKTAAYLVKTALDVAGSLDGSSVWCFSDIFEEWHPFVEPFHGGFGLLNQDGIPKPGFWGLKLLSLCGDERIDLGEKAMQGEIGAAAFKGLKSMQVLLFRQQMKNDDNTSKEAVSVHIPLAHLPKSVTVMRIDAEHGNPLRVWQEEYKCRNDLNAQEIHEIIEKTKVQQENWPYTFNRGEMKADMALGVNDVYLLQIAY